MKYILYIINLLVVIITSYLVYEKVKENKNIEKIEPVELSPMEINYLARDLHYINRGILATLLDLYNRKKIDIEKYKRDSRNKSIADHVIEYKLTLLDDTDLDKVESTFIHLTFGDNSTITTDQLTQNHLEGKERYFNRWGEWLLVVEESLVNKGILGTKTGDKKHYLYFSLFSILVGILSIYNREIIGLVSLISAMGLAVIYLGSKISKTPQGTSVSAYLWEQISLLESGQMTPTEDYDTFLQWIALACPLNLYKGLYTGDDPIIQLFLTDVNENGGSLLDDGVMRAFLGFRKPSRKETLDTNRVTFGK